MFLLNIQARALFLILNVHLLFEITKFSMENAIGIDHQCRIYMTKKWA